MANTNTPIKQKLSICIVCAKSPKEIRRVESTRNNENRPSLKELLFKYGGINIESGIICRKCFIKLEHLDSKCVEFYTNCQQNVRKTIVQNVKRMASSPAVPVQKRREPSDEVLCTKDVLTSSDHSYANSTSAQVFVGKCSKKSLNFTDCENKSTVCDNERTEHTYAKTTATKKTNFTKPKTTNSKNIIYHPIIQHITSSFQSSLDKTEQLSDLEKLKLLETLSCDKAELSDIAKSILDIQSLKNAIIKCIIDTINQNVEQMGKRKNFYISELMKKEPDDLKHLNWCDIVNEMMVMFPFLFHILTGMMLNSTKMRCHSQIQKVIPRLGMVYSLIMQGRNMELSRVQRTMSMILMDNICDQKVYDRLQTVGVCLSYSRTLEISDKVGNEFSQYIMDLLSKGKRFRIVGDNINWHSGVRDLRMDNRDHMHHAFGSAIIVQNMDFEHCDDSALLQHYEEISVSDFLPSLEDFEEIRKDYVVLMSRVAVKYIPFFKSFEDIIPDTISSPCQPEMKQVSEVIPMAVLFENEQYYQDVVRIMSYYEEFLAENCHNAGVDLSNIKIHIGGDQLTRERFSGAKAMRAHHEDPAERFHHLGPITFEFFHLFMNYLQLIFKTLYDKSSGGDMATLKSLQDRISRSNVGENIKQHYDQDKEFFISCVDAYILEAVMEFFGMEDRMDNPKKHQPPSFKSVQEKQTWYFEKMSQILSATAFSKSVQETTKEEKTKVDGHTFQLKLQNGKTITLTKCTKQNSQPEDGVFNYACVLLEQGLLFKDLLDFAKTPERERGIRLLKLAMVYFRSMNKLSKYAYEILRLLVHQLCTLTEKEANEEFYNLFVNTTGQVNGHIPCDLRMEHLVREVKDHLKHMFSNKTEANIHCRTRAIAGIADIGKNFDQNSRVIVRSKKHCHKSALVDEMCMLKDLRKVRPFKIQTGRRHAAFPTISRSVVHKLDVSNLHDWIHAKKFEFATEKGN